MGSMKAVSWLWHAPGMPSPCRSQALELHTISYQPHRRRWEGYQSGVVYRECWNKANSNQKVSILANLINKMTGLIAGTSWDQELKAYDFGCEAEHHTHAGMVMTWCNSLASSRAQHILSISIDTVVINTRNLQPWTLSVNAVQTVSEEFSKAVFSITNTAPWS